MAQGGQTLLARVVVLLRLLSEAGSASPQELIARSGLARPTVHRLLAMLLAEGLVVRERRGSYRLGLVLQHWGRAALAAVPWLATVGPLLKALSRELGTTVQLYTREGDARICAAAAGGGDEPAVGRPLPLDAGPSGQVLMAWSKRSTSAADGGGLAAVQARGWCCDTDESAGVTSLCVPVFHPLHGIVGALCVLAPAAWPRHGPGNELTERVSAAAREIEAALSPY